jgi:hypothetical protein
LQKKTDPKKRFFIFNNKTQRDMNDCILLSENKNEIVYIISGKKVIYKKEYIRIKLENSRSSIDSLKINLIFNKKYYEDQAKDLYKNIGYSNNIDVKFTNDNLSFVSYKNIILKILSFASYISKIRNRLYSCELKYLHRSRRSKLADLDRTYFVTEFEENVPSPLHKEQNIESDKIIFNYNFEWTFNFSLSDDLDKELKDINDNISKIISTNSSDNIDKYTKLLSKYNPVLDPFEIKFNIHKFFVDNKIDEHFFGREANIPYFRNENNDPRLGINELMYSVSRLDPNNNLISFLDTKYEHIIICPKKMINERDVFGRTPLLYVEMCHYLFNNNILPNRTKIIKYLVKNGADIYAKDHLGLDILEYYNILKKYPKFNRDSDYNRDGEDYILKVRLIHKMNLPRELQNICIDYLSGHDLTEKDIFREKSEKFWSEHDI